MKLTDRQKADLAKQERRLGPTTGASKGRKPAPPAKVKITKLSPNGIAGRWKKEF